MTPTVKSAFVALIAAGLKLLCDQLGIVLDDGVLTAIAAGIIAWILGDASGEATVKRFRRGAKG
jgi:hypothetical protein